MLIHMNKVVRDNTQSTDLQNYTDFQLVFVSLTPLEKEDYYVLLQILWLHEIKFWKMTLHSNENPAYHIHKAVLKDLNVRK